MGILSLKWCSVFGPVFMCFQSFVVPFVLVKCYWLRFEHQVHPRAKNLHLVFCLRIHHLIFIFRHEVGTVLDRIDKRLSRKGFFSWVGSEEEGEIMRSFAVIWINYKKRNWAVINRTKKPNIGFTSTVKIIWVGSIKSEFYINKFASYLKDQNQFSSSSSYSY